MDILLKPMKASVHVFCAACAGRCFLFTDCDRRHIVFIDDDACLWLTKKSKEFVEEDELFGSIDEGDEFCFACG